MDEGIKILYLVTEIDDGLRAVQIDAKGHGHLLVEAHSGGHVEDNVDAISEQILIVLGDSQVAHAAIAGNWVDLVAELGLLLLERLEEAVLENRVHTRLHIFAFLVPHEHVDCVNARTGAQQLLDDHWRRNNW